MLKLIGAALMLIDHIGMVFFPDLFILRLIGRMAMPIFAYSVAVGFYHTKHFKKYLARMGGFALISQIPYVIMVLPTYYGENIKELFRVFKGQLFFQYWNIGVTFFIALLILYCYKKGSNIGIGEKIIYWLVILFLGVLSIKLNCDYGLYGALMPLMFYVTAIERNNKNQTILGMVLLLIVRLPYGLQGALVQLPAIFAIGIIERFREERKNRFSHRLKYFFYAFYPLHMFLLGIIKILY